MRILYLSQYFPPEAGATQTRAFEMTRNLARLGHSVTVICEFPNHPSGILPPQYRRRLYEVAELEAVRVIRVPVAATANKSFASRMAFYLSYMATAALAGLLLARGRFDIVYATSPPLFTGAAGLFLSTWKRARYIFEVRDLWPESAVALGELTNPAAIQLAARLENACYRRAAKIVVVTQGILDSLAARGVPLEKLALIPNGASLEDFQFDPAQRAGLRSQLGLEGKFVALYAGIFGIAQGLETLVEAARLLVDHPQVQIVLLGEGPRKAAITSMAASYGLRNLIILPEVRRESMPGYLSAADLALVPLRDLPLFRGALPSKIFDAWACQRPVLHTIDGEARRLVELAGGGVFTPPEDPARLAEAILVLSYQHAKLEEMGAYGRAYTQTNYSRRALAEKLASLLIPT